MGYIGNKICSHGFNASQFRHHLIKIQEHQIQIIMMVGRMNRRYINRKISLSYLFGCSGQLLHGLIIRFYDFASGKIGKPRSHQGPVHRRHGDLNQRMPLILINQRD